MKKIFLLSLTMAATCSLVNAQTAPTLKIYSGVRDTLTTPKTTVVAVTTPGATATINGMPVHVYNTGSFGLEVNLQPGDNIINIVAEQNGKSTNVERHIYYKDKAKNTKKGETGEPVTYYFPEAKYVTTLPGAYLQYGNGGDRLGGSKMGFLDPDITLKVIGEAGYVVKSDEPYNSNEKSQGHFDGGSLYCVRLASNRLAYIPKEYTKPATAGPAVVNTGSWSVTNTGKTDKVVVGLPVRLPYQYSTTIDPQIITVDIFGATDNSNWITQRSATLGIIEYVNFQQVSDDVYRVILRLKDKYQWGYSVGYEGNNLVINVRHRPESLRLKDLVIGLDAGHGGEYPGAISPSGIKEKDVNLDIVLKMRELLQKKGAKVVLTRDSDTGPSMAERKKIWKDANVDLAISVHNNSGGGALSSPGTAVLYKHLSNRPLGQAVLKRLLETGLPLFGLVENFNFSLNGPTDYPNVLVEGMFMSSLAEEEKLADPKFRQLVAEKIVAAIEDYLRSAQ